MAFTFTFVDVIVVSDLKKIYWRIDGFWRKKRHGSADLHTSIHLLPYSSGLEFG